MVGVCSPPGVMEVVRGIDGLSVKLCGDGDVNQLVQVVRSPIRCKKIKFRQWSVSLSSLTSERSLAGIWVHEALDEGSGGGGEDAVDDVGDADEWVGQPASGWDD